MILTAGLTPAWQQILVFDGFRLGEVNRAVEARWCASGKVLNVGIAAHRLGGPSLTLAPAGGAVLAEMQNDLAALGVPCRWIQTQAATRVCTTILDRAGGTTTELVENGRPLSAGELDAYLAAYREEAAKADVAVITGSLPAGAPESFYRRLMEVTPCPAVLDFRGEGLLSVLDFRPLVVKPNREELSRTVGHRLDSEESLLEAMRQLNHRGAQWVVITQGKGPVWMTSATETYRLVPPVAQKVVNTIGCGDALTATIAWATRNGDRMVDAVRLGIAAAGANLAQLFPCHFDPTAIQEKANAVQAESR